MLGAACKSFLTNGNLVSVSGAALKLWILPGATSWSWNKSNCGMTPRELPPSIHLCHLPNLPDKPANFPITCGTICYQRASQFLNGKQEQTIIKPEMCLLPLWFSECPWGTDWRWFAWPWRAITEFLMCSLSLPLQASTTYHRCVPEGRQAGVSGASWLLVLSCCLELQPPICPNLHVSFNFCKVPGWKYTFENSILTEPTVVRLLYRAYTTVDIWWFWRRRAVIFESHKVDEVKKLKALLIRT